MATWTLKTLYKKSAYERQHWYKDGKEIIREEGYRWGTFYCESDEQPEIASRHDVKGFPTIVLFKGGKKIHFEGPRNLDNFMQFIQSN